MYVHLMKTHKTYYKNNPLKLKSAYFEKNIYIMLFFFWGRASRSWHGGLALSITGSSSFLHAESCGLHREWNRCCGEEAIADPLQLIHKTSRQVPRSRRRNTQFGTHIV